MDMITGSQEEGLSEESVTAWYIAHTDIRKLSGLENEKISSGIYHRFTGAKKQLNMSGATSVVSISDDGSLVHYLPGTGWDQRVKVI